jgi:hypothetical protein
LLVDPPLWLALAVEVGGGIAIAAGVYWALIWRRERHRGD